MTNLTRNQLYLLARAAAKGASFKIEFTNRPMAIAFLCDVAGLPSRAWKPTQKAHYSDRWYLADGYVAEIGIDGLVVFHPPYGLEVDHAVVCPQCAAAQGVWGTPQSPAGYPDGFTCDACGDVIEPQ